MFYVLFHSHIVILVDSVGQVYRQGIMGMAWLCLVMSETLAGKVQTAGGDSAAREWNYLEVLGWLKGWTQLGLSGHLHVASSHDLGSSQHSGLKVVGLCQCRLQKWASQWARQKLHCPCDLGSQKASLLPNSTCRSSPKPAQIQREKR